MSISSLASSGCDGRSRSSSGRALSLGRNRRNKIGSPIWRPPRQSSCTTSTTTTQQFPQRVRLPDPSGCAPSCRLCAPKTLRPERVRPNSVVIDRHDDRPALLWDEHRHQELQQPQPELVGVPARAREKVMRTAVMPTAGEPRGLEHPRDGAITNPADEPDHKHAERLKRRLREHRPTKGQQTRERTGNLTHGGDPPSWAGHGKRLRQRPAADGLVAHRIRGRRHNRLLRPSNHRRQRPPVSHHDPAPDPEI